MTSTSTPVRDIEITALANGVRVITEAMPHVRSVSVGIWIGSGSRRETAEENGRKPNFFVSQLARTPRRMGYLLGPD